MRDVPDPQATGECTVKKGLDALQGFGLLLYQQGVEQTLCAQFEDRIG